jgi:hypothetical protein
MNSPGRPIRECGPIRISLFCLKSAGVILLWWSFPGSGSRRQGRLVKNPGRRPTWRATTP